MTSRTTYLWDQLQQGYAATKKKLVSFLERASPWGINQRRVLAALGQYLIPQIYPAPYSLNNDDPGPPESSLFHLFICANKNCQNLKCADIWVCVMGIASREKDDKLFDSVAHLIKTKMRSF